MTYRKLNPLINRKWAIWRCISQPGRTTFLNRISQLCTPGSLLCYTVFVNNSRDLFCSRLCIIYSWILIYVQIGFLSLINVLSWKLVPQKLRRSNSLMAIFFFLCFLLVYGVGEWWILQVGKAELKTLNLCNNAFTCDKFSSVYPVQPSLPLSVK